MLARGVAIVGAGRMGGGLARALAETGRRVSSLVRRDPVRDGSFFWPESRWLDALNAHRLVLIATPDDAIASVARVLEASGAIQPDHVILHLSGLLDRTALRALEGTGAALGSFHPLQTVVDPATARERLRGAFAAVEGDPGARAAGESLARELGMHAVKVPSAGKADYHIGATVVANYSAALLALGEQFALRAGIEAELAEKLYRPLMTGAVANLAALGPTEALTGAIRRGDSATVAAHLARLDGRERRLYCDLGTVALGLARAGGLDEGLAARIEAMLAAQ